MFQNNVNLKCIAYIQMKKKDIYQPTHLPTYPTLEFRVGSGKHAYGGLISQIEGNILHLCELRISILVKTIEH
jgi:hypothetical protein